MSDLVTMWPPRRLDDLADVDPDILSAGTPPDFEFFYIDISSVRPGFIAVPETRIRFAEAPSRARKRITVGDVLMSSVRPNLQAFALFDRTDGEYVASTGFAVIRPRDGNSGRFILHSLFSDNVTAQVRRLVVGSNYPAINTPDIAGLRLPTPDPAEQDAIAAILDAVDDAITRTERTIAKLKLIKGGLLHDLMTRGIDENGELRDTISHPGLFKDSILGKIPEGWNVKRLNELAETVFSSVDKKTRSGEQRIRLCNYIDAYNNEYLTGGESFFMSATASPDEIRRFSLHKGDIVVTKDSETPDDIGISCVITQEPVNLVCGYHLALVRPDQDQMSPIFLSKQMKHFRMARYFGKMCNGLTRYGLPVSAFTDALIVVPSLREQDQIAAILRGHDIRIYEESRKRAKLMLVKRGLMHDLLTGRVRVPTESSNSDASTDSDDAPRTERKANIYFMRSVLAAEIVEQMHEDATFGHVKFQKTLFLCERVAGLDLETRYHRAAAGPHDNRLMRSVDGQMKKQKWFRVVPRGVGADGKPVGWAYERMEKAGGHREWFEKYWAAARERIQRVIDMLRPLDTRRCEVVATLYSAWEDLLAAGREATDDAIVNEVLTNWHESKQAIPRDTWNRALGWMRKQELQPATIGTR